jgi:integrase
VNFAGPTTYVATTTKSWTGNGIDPTSMIEEIAKEHAYVACQLEGQQVFGLRTSESMQLCPAKDRQGDMLVVSRGTKGGRTRVIPIENQAQYDWLEKAAELAALTNRGNLIHGDRTYKQALNHRNYVARKFGITKAELGVVPHGLRAGYAEDRFHLVTGVPAPTRGGGFVTPEEDRQGRVEVSRALGHSRGTIANAYIGARLQNQHTV